MTLPGIALLPPAGASLSSGKYIMLLPPSTSTMTLLVFVKTDSIASIYKRSRVTSGAFSYSARS